jgi:hypothetical protein
MIREKRTMVGFALLLLIEGGCASPSVTNDAATPDLAPVPTNGIAPGVGLALVALIEP